MLAVAQAPLAGMSRSRSVSPLPAGQASGDSKFARTTISLNSMGSIVCGLIGSMLEGVGEHRSLKSGQHPASPALPSNVVAPVAGDSGERHCGIRHNDKMMVDALPCLQPMFHLHHVLFAVTPSVGHAQRVTCPRCSTPQDLLDSSPQHTKLYIPNVSVLLLFHRRR